MGSGVFLRSARGACCGAAFIVNARFLRDAELDRRDEFRLGDRLKLVHKHDSDIQRYGDYQCGIERSRCHDVRGSSKCC